MTSEQVLLILATIGLLGFGGCSRWLTEDPEDHLSTGIYPQRQLWAVVPMRNESGSGVVDARVADHLTQRLEVEPGIDTLPVNRVLAAMDAMAMKSVASPADALRLRQMLGVDGLVVGTVTAFDPYDPPKLGMAIELYVDPHLPWFEEGLNVRRLSRAAVDEQTRPVNPTASTASTGQPLSVVSGYFDAADPRTRRLLRDYADKRGVDPRDKHGWRLYRIDMDLYTEFVTHAVGSRLLDAEAMRLGPQPRTAAQQTAS